MRLFLTGGTGFLGRELLTELHARGHEISALVRSPQRAAGFPADVRPVQGSIEDPESYRRALAGHDALVHAAALVKMWRRDRKDFDRVNVEGTENVILAASDAGGMRTCSLCYFTSQVGDVDRLQLNGALAADSQVSQQDVRVRASGGPARRVR